MSAEKLAVLVALVVFAGAPAGSFFSATCRTISPPAVPAT